MTSIDAIYDELTIYVKELDDTFIAQFFPVDPTINPEEYQNFVKAYCVLSHAAIEEFFETAALNVIDESINRWINQRVTTDSLLALISYTGQKISVEDDMKVFDILRNALESSQKIYSNMVYKNHGISIDYLRELMIPIAVDITTDLNLRNSLAQLASERGTYAHKGKVNRILSPEDARKFVSDCLDICSDIRDKIGKKLA